MTFAWPDVLWQWRGKRAGAGIVAGIVVIFSTLAP